jgi:hypothetical protein
MHRRSWAIRERCRIQSGIGLASERQPIGEDGMVVVKARECRRAG